MGRKIGVKATMDKSQLVSIVKTWDASKGDTKGNNNNFKGKDGGGKKDGGKNGKDGKKDSKKPHKKNQGDSKKKEGGEKVTKKERAKRAAILAGKRK